MPGDREIQAVDFGPIRAHAVSLDEAVDLIAERAASGRGGFVLTPNLDHLALSRRNPEFAAAYGRAFLSLVDGMPLVATSRLLRLPIREKVSGSDLLEPLMFRCARDRLPIFFLGATPETCEAAGRKLRAQYPGIELAGYDASHFDLEDTRPGAARDALRRARENGALLVLACLPPVKQLILSRFEDDYRPAVGIGVGSTLAFYAGEVPRAPAWMSRVGLEWLHRFWQEPRRLWRRYLIDDPQALPIFLRMSLDRARGRPLHHACRLVTSPLVEGGGETP
jgi:N-acetylglucosaminyldiphosphoundecaprenol N-acetyl-beta-D-mannosaminyltransferase